MPNSSSEDYTLGFVEANLYALTLFLPITAIYVLPYGWMYGWATLGTDIVLFFSNLPVFLISLIVGTIAHECIHAICWAWLDDIPWGKIHFGFKWSSLTPYVHCPEPVKIGNYRWGVAMPGILLGIFPYLLALLLQNGWLLGFGFFFSLAAGGDILILWLLRNVEAGSQVQDHPEMVGCNVYRSKL